MSSGNFQFIENCGNDWCKYLDVSTGCYFFWNKVTEESSWTIPKKVFTEKDQSTFVIDQYINEEGYNEQDTVQLKRKLSDPLHLRCLKCNDDYKVLEHNYCENCYNVINNYECPLISTYKIKCKGCHGWGLFLVQPNGYCNSCTKNIKELKPISSYDNLQLKKASSDTLFPRCLRCGGWGKDLLQPNRMCNHCIIKQEEEAFDTRWKTKCKVCGGWGLDLVGLDGFCNHCRSLAQNQVKYSQNGASKSEFSTVHVKRKLDSLYDSF